MLNIESENGTPLDNQIEKADHQDETADENVEPFDYTHVHAVARIALYDDLRSAPRVTEIHRRRRLNSLKALHRKFMNRLKTPEGPFRTPSSAKYRKTSIHARFAEATVVHPGRGQYHPFRPTKGRDTL